MSRAHMHYLGQRGFLRCLNFLPQKQRLTAYSSPLLFTPGLCIWREKARTASERNCSSSGLGLPSPVPQQTPCAIILNFPPAHWCQHMHHRIRVGEHAPNSVICHQSFYDASFPWLLSVCSLSALHHHCTVHSNYFGCSLQFELFLPFVRGLGGVFSCLIKGLCLQYQVFE